MNLRLSVLVGLMFFAMVSPTYANEERATQTGEAVCTGGPYRALTCPYVTFPTPFGGVPSLSLSTGGFEIDSGGATFSGVTINPQASELTATGFRLSVTPPGALKSCRIIWIAVGPALLNGVALPRYMVLTVIYSPPGTNGGHSTSSVSYGAGSTTGTTTAASQSFKSSISRSLEGSGGFLGTGGGSSVSFEYSRSNTDSQALEIKKSSTSTINQAGPSQDGITHDEDEIWLVLNPTVNLALSSSSAAWMLGNASSPSPIQYVHVGWLNGHQSMPTGVATALQSAGITPQDYSDILARDPLAGGSSALAPSRFVSLNTTFPYEPPYSQNDPVPTVTFSISNSSTATTGSAIEDSYKVAMSMSATGDFLGFAKATLKDTASWEWTNKSSQSSATGTSQSATVTVGGPAYGYAGGTVMAVYLDTMYNTFVFAIVPVVPKEIGLDGTLVNRSGKPLPFAEVTLFEVETGILHRTFTNSKGEYKFAGPVTGPSRIQVQAVGVTQMLPRTGSTTARHVALRMP